MSRERPTGKSGRSPSGRLFFPAPALTAALSLVLLMLGLISQPAAASGRGAAVRAKLNPVAEITIDDDGRPLHYPNSVFYEPAHQEIFLINGGTSRVVVYNDDFFPLVSAGKGRGVHTPQGIFVTDNGSLYVTQIRPSPRITILNGAFFVTREIELGEIPELAEFMPSNLAVSRDGTIYLAGGNSLRGVLVLDDDGTLLRRLEPMGMIADQEAIAAAALSRDAEKWALDPEEEARALEALLAVQEQEEQALMTMGQAMGTRGAEPGAAGETRPRAEAYGDIPEEFRPRDPLSGEITMGLGPVRVGKVVFDRKGRLYLVSTETGRVFVYDADETFLFAFGTKGGSPRQLSQPRGVAVDHERELLFVVDYMRHMILIYDFEGEFLAEVGGFGFSPGWFNHPSDIAIDRRGRLIIPDLFNRRIQILAVEIEATQPAEPSLEPPEPPSPDPGDFPLVDPSSYPEEMVIEEEILPEEPISP